MHNDYGLRIVQVEFLPLGFDPKTAVYRAIADDATPYFVKLRRGFFDELAVALPKFLCDQGIGQIIAPLTTATGQLWASLEAFKLILFPFVEGHNGFEVDLSDRQWGDFGLALKRLHTTVVPPELSGGIRQETYSPRWRKGVETFLEYAETGTWIDPVAVRLATFLMARREEIHDLVGRAERLALVLQTQAPEFVICHSDVHAGNILVDTNDALYIVDWDNPIQAPKERDLMFIGGGQGFRGCAAQEEETLFYRGYGQTHIDPMALAYYRYERIIEDIAVFCEQLFLTDEGGEDREQSLSYLMANFLPNNSIEIAYASDKRLRNG